jgi:2-oxoisovalerate dehydrogenase E1 component
MQMVFTKEQAMDALSMMERARHFEERTDLYFKAKRMHGTTHLAIGQEASEAGLALALDDGDWIVPTHRNHEVTLCRGTKPEAMFSEMFGSRNGICKGLGGSMHMTDIRHWNAGSSAVVASGVPLALGLAFAQKRRRTGKLAVAIFGDGATSRGAVHECMNLASVWSIPLLFYCENNGYGMSASVSRMVATDEIAKRAEGYRMAWNQVDGNDIEQVYLAVRKASDYIKKEGKPYFLEVKTYRENGHSKSDTCAYRTREEEEAWKKKDPIHLFATRLVTECIATQSEVAAILASAEKRIDDAASLAEQTADDHLSLQEALSCVFEPEGRFSSEQGNIHKGSYREAIREALDEEMTRSSSVVMLGEDIGTYGGCFKVSGDLYKRHPDQVLETPVSEESFSGMAVGASLVGMRPVVEIMYGDFCTLVSDPLINHAAKIHFMSAGQLSCPLVLRSPMGSGTGHGSQHTQSLEGMFASVPGLIVMAPSTPKDAKGMLKSAIRSNNPVLFVEQKLLYGTEGDIEGENFLVPIGKAEVKKEGKDVTIVCYGRAVLTSLEAARVLEGKGVSAEVVDLRTLRPMDKETVFASVRKTGRLVMVEESPVMGSYGSDIVASVCLEGIPLLTKPVLLGGKDCPVPFAKDLEARMVPSVDEVVQSVRQM